MGDGSTFDAKYFKYIEALHRNGGWPAPPGVTSERRLEGLCIHFLICCLLSVCNIFTTPKRIRVASVFEFSVCLSVCSLFSVLLKFSNLFILQYRSGPPKPVPTTCPFLFYSILKSLRFILYP